MPLIHELDSDTINKIAAGEVIERPSAVVKELLENAIDAKANSITVEIKDGGISFIRITDNGTGINADDIELAFKRHSTSKISSVEDLFSITSLGFRGEALSSIASVSQVELITKTSSSFLGIRYVIEGGEHKTTEEIGCPQGTTFIVRNLFYNTPVRRKFLKSAQTEAGYVSAVIEKMISAHPEISFKFITNGNLKLHSSGNSNLKDIIYTIYGRDICSNLLEVNESSGNLNIDGYIGKPVVTRGNRNYEIFYINGRCIKSHIISKALEEAYKPYIMAHKYPFAILNISIPPETIDVNVHPTKMEIRFSNNEEIYNFIYNSVKNILSGKNLIQQVPVDNKTENTIAEAVKPMPKIIFPEPFENIRKQEIAKKESSIKENIINEKPATYITENITKQPPVRPVTNNFLKRDVELVAEPTPESPVVTQTPINKQKTSNEEVIIQEIPKPVQESLFESEDFKKDNPVRNYRIIGQLFATYWIIECENNMYIIDQHAAHEKVIFEKMINNLKNKTNLSQTISPPTIITLTLAQESIVKEYDDIFKKLGFEIEHFGENDYSVSAIPADLPGVNNASFLVELIDSLEENSKGSYEQILEKVASMSCKAAVKGNHHLSEIELKALLDDLMSLDNPFNCPHGRPTIISMSKYDIEKKFKRIV